MGYIKQLSEDLIKKIAAGEVIERPASVVKELVENSIDAGATKIEIEIERSGKYIKVSDNGMGIDPDDVNLLFARHATSKIKRFDDLWSIKTLGFRGEALASISAVSKITCRSKHIDQEYGFELKIADEKTNKKTSAIAIGTAFEIDDLFYNVPARQKFLKSETTEIGHVYDAVISEALSRPKAAITLLNNKNVLLKSSGSNNFQQTIVELLGIDLKDKLIPISSNNDFMDLSGFISTLEVFRADRKSIFIFVNNRPIKCQIVSKAIFSACEGLLPAGKYPIVVLNLNFKTSFVDVNVHPTKKEVRYNNPNDVYSLVLRSIQSAIAEHYKKEYKEKSLYSLPENNKEVVANGHSNLELQSPVISRPTDLLLKVELPLAGKTSELQDFKTSRPSAKGGPASGGQNLSTLSLFSVDNLKCKLIHSDKPIAKMTKIGNKTIFEVGTIFDENVQVIFSGEVIGDQSYQKEFFNSLSELAAEIFKNYSYSEPAIQKKLIQPSLNDDSVKKQIRKKPPEKLLYEVWERDNWSCVYCGKQLLDPDTVKSAIKEAEDAFITYINEDGKEVTNHILREHSASYDHYLPVSKMPQFNFDTENLFACCFECNRKKLDSMELKSWMPVKKNSWTKELEIGGICFKSPKTFCVKTDVVG
ncbi:MAG: DNA mismatch repair endonuclease MutL [Candidatus Melainabacteria bacterium]|nr:DNA mismatch repair endonuclease MutL [Candidatus Melainabacteria bacterium]